MQHFEFFKRVIFYGHTLEGGNLFASFSCASLFLLFIDFFKEIVDYYPAFQIDSIQKCVSVFVFSRDAVVFMCMCASVGFFTHTMFRRRRKKLKHVLFHVI